MTIGELLPTPSIEQLDLLHLVAEIFVEHQRWPTFQWVEERMEEMDTDARTLIEEMPRLPSGLYGYLRQTPVTLNPTCEIRLTVAGLSQSQSLQPLLDRFAKFVGAIGTIRARNKVDPFEPIELSIPIEQVISETDSISAGDQTLADIAMGEPLIWKCSFIPGDNGIASVTPDASIRKFKAVRNLNDYFEVFQQGIQEVSRGVETIKTSELSLAQSIDYLDVVWELAFGENLLKANGMVRSARLASMPYTEEQVSECLSSLSDLFSRLNISENSGKRTLDEMKVFLKTNLPEESYQVIDNALDVLHAIRNFRNYRQHYNGNKRILEACQKLGIRFPISDWGATWQIISNQAALAFSTIREEVRASNVRSNLGKAERPPLENGE